MVDEEEGGNYFGVNDEGCSKGNTGPPAPALFWIGNNAKPRCLANQISLDLALNLTQERNRQRA
jgi:hypothetical protein